ncbi:MAG: molybdenum cofactor guanylyltransferase MobA [Alphaproteobacteria bacterium]
MERGVSDVAGVVLAGGRASRMGGADKGLMTVAGAPMLERVIARLRPQVGLLALNVNGDPARFAPFALPVIADVIDGHAGPLAGVLTGLEWAAGSSKRWLATVPNDTPFLPRDLVARLAAAAVSAGADLACAASAGRTHPVVGLWRTSLAGDLRRAMVEEGMRKVDAWTARHRLATVDFATEPVDPFFNVNAPDDLVEAERLAERDR